jgi:GTP-binding protein LepA
MNIRNFSIIAHIDHGKSTLADRMLEITNTIEKRKMKDQILDSMELERERGITIKMQPVRMNFKYREKDYILNLIDTPGHIDFSYEVSRALNAVEGAILLVDSTQGVQAQTLTTLEMAKSLGLTIIPVLSKIDSPLAKIDEVSLEVATLLDIDPDEIITVSGKTGENVEYLLTQVVERIKEPVVLNDKSNKFKSLVFDFKYDEHRGVIMYVRIIEGSVSKGDYLFLHASKENFIALDVGYFSPEEKPCKSLESGMIGYVVTGIKKPGIASVGDTLTHLKNQADALPGYTKPVPVVWASIYPESQDDFLVLKTGLSKLRLSDASFSFEEETSGALGRGFRCGFLGMLHLEIITERIRRELSLEIIITTPSITYIIEKRNGEIETIYSPHLFPNDGQFNKVLEPWVNIQIILPSHQMSILVPVLYDHEAQIDSTENFGDNRSKMVVKMPLREMMRDFFDQLKSLTSGYASISYEIGEMKEADVTRLDIIVANDIIPAFSKVISRRRAVEEAEVSVEKLHSLLPRQMFSAKIQGFALGRILSSRTLQAFRKDVTGYLYGGDYTRKMKLLEKQKKGKKKMKERGEVNIPQDVFLKMMKSKD